MTQWEHSSRMQIVVRFLPVLDCSDISPCGPVLCQQHHLVRYSYPYHLFLIYSLVAYSQVLQPMITTHYTLHAIKLSFPKFCNLTQAWHPQAWVTSAAMLLYYPCLRSFCHLWCTLDEKNLPFLYRLGRQSYRLLEISSTCLPSVNGNTFFAGERNTVRQNISQMTRRKQKTFFLLESDIIHLKTAGMSLIVLNSVKAANDLLDKRSSIYSNR